MEKQSLILTGSVSFRHWSRQSYAVFSSLGKNIRIGVLCLSYSILVMPSYAQTAVAMASDQQVSDSLDLDEVVVSAQLSPTIQSELMRVVQVISRPEIEQAPVRDLASLLKSIRSVDIRQRGAYGMQADISIRGGTFDQTLILLNGMNLTDPQTGHHNLNLPVDLTAIERIEVLQGAAARIFGPNAFNGAVNIITRDPEKSHLSLTLTGGEFGYGHLGVSTASQVGNSQHHLSFSGSTSNGFTDNTDFRGGNLYYHGRFSALNNSALVDLQAGIADKAFGANSFYTPRFPNQFEETRTFFTTMGLSIPKIKIHPRFYWRRHTDRFELFRENPPDWYASHNYHMTDVVGANVSRSFTGRLGNTTLGLDYRFEQIYSNVLGDTLSQPVAVTRHDDVFFTRYSQRSGLSIMAEQNIYVGSFSFSAGLLTWFNSMLDSKVGFFPGIDMGWQATKDLRLVSSINRTLRLPTFTDLYYVGPTNVGNPMLKPEEAISAEVGLKWENSWIKADVAVFQRWGTQMIDWIMEPGDEKWRSMNLTRVDIIGFETGFTIPLSINRSAGQADFFSAQYSHIASDKSSGDFASNYVLDHFRNKLDFTFNGYITQKWGANITVSWLDRAGGFMLYREGVFEELQDFEPYWITDLRVNYKPGSVQFFVEASNVFDAQYVTVANVPQPGRWLRAGLGFNPGGD